MRGFKPTKNINVSILEHASRWMVSTFIEFCFQLQPSISVYVISLHCSLAPFKLFKLHESLIASTPNSINKSIIALTVSKISPTSMHKFSFF